MERRLGKSKFPKIKKKTYNSKMNNRNNYNTEDSARKVRQLRQKTQQLLRHLHYQQQHPDPLIKAVREAVQRSEEDLHSDATTINKPTGRDLLLRFDETRPPPAPRQLNAGSRGKSVGRQSTKSLLEQQFEFRQRMQRSVSPLRRRSSNRQSTSIETSQLRYGFHSSLKVGFQSISSLLVWIFMN